MVYLSEFKKKLNIFFVSMYINTSMNTFITIISIFFTMATSVPLNRTLIGGCVGTEYGCCPNTTITKLDNYSSNCNTTNMVILGGCEGTEYGCCPNTTIPKLDNYSCNTANTTLIGGCVGTEYGCCPNTTIPKLDNYSSNCNTTYM